MSARSRRSRCNILVPTSSDEQTPPLPPTTTAQGNRPQQPTLAEQLAVAQQELDQYRLASLARDVETRLRAENEARFRDLEARLTVSPNPSLPTSAQAITARDKILLKLNLDGAKKFDSTSSASSMRLFFAHLASLFEDADAIGDESFCIRVLKSLLDDSASNALALELNRLREERIPATYAHAKTFLFNKYHANFSRDMEDAFLAIRQGSDTVLAYSKRFDDILLQLPKRSEDAKISKFINGLSYSLRTDVAGQRRLIKTLQDAIDTARDKEAAVTQRIQPSKRPKTHTFPHQGQAAAAFHTLVHDDDLSCLVSDDDNTAGDSETDYAYSTMLTSNPNRIKLNALECPYCDEPKRHFRKDCAIWTAETHDIFNKLMNVPGLNRLKLISNLLLPASLTHPFPRSPGPPTPCHAYQQSF
jgi:hypothetical protein